MFRQKASRLSFLSILFCVATFVLIGTINTFSQIDLTKKTVKIFDQDGDYCVLNSERYKGGCPVGENIPMETPLLDAIKKGDVDTLKRLISEGANVNEEGKRLVQTPLTFAASYGDIQMMKILINAGAYVQGETKYGGTPLMASTRCSQAVKLILENGASAKYLNKNKQNALMSAISNRNRKSIDILLEYGANVRVKDVDNTTPLILAIKQNDFDLLEKLLKLGAEKDLEDEKVAYNALHSAVQNNSLEMLNLLLDKGVDPNIRINNHTNILVRAAMFSKPEIVKRLIEVGSIIDIKDAQTPTALTWASNYGRTEIVRMLVKAGADVTFQKNWSPFISAARNGHVEVMQILLDAGAKIDRRAYDRTTALMMAVSSNQLEAVKFLIKKGADVNAKDEERNWSALIIARAHLNSNKSDKKRQEIVRILIEAGAIE